MKAGPVRIGFFITALALQFLVPARAAATDVSAALARADAIRRIDPARFDRMLARIQPSLAGATEADRRYFRLLTDYRKTLLGQYESAVGDAIVLFDQAPEIEIKYRAALLIANASALKRDYVLGLRYLDRALELQPKVTNPAIRHLGDSVAGTLYGEFGHHDLALESVNRLLADGPDANSRCAAKQVRSHELQATTPRRKESEAEIQEAITDCSSQGEVIAVNILRTDLARYWAASGKRAQAIALMDASLPEVQATGYKRLIGEFHSLLAKILLETGNVAAAEIHAKKVSAIAGHDPYWGAGVVAHHVLYETALRRNDFATALAEYRAYAEADKARLDDIKAREYAFQLSQHEVKEKTQSIALLSGQNQLLRLQQEVARRTAWNFRLAIALLVVLAASFGYWGWRARRTHGSLRQLAETDSLTGLSNRRDFRQRSEAALAVCAQRRRPVSMLLFDLDFFKQINDQCGHSSGDWVLREVARVGRMHCREGDLYGRIGGEEFAMALIDCDIEAAVEIAEACRRSIAAIDANAAGCMLPVATSIGAVSTAVSGYDYEALIAHADAAMYRSKVAGRNRVSIYQAPPVTESGQVVRLDSRNASAMLKEY